MSMNLSCYTTTDPAREIKRTSSMPARQAGSLPSLRDIKVCTCIPLATRYAISMHCWLGVNPVGADGGVVAGRLAGLAQFALGEIQ